MSRKKSLSCETCEGLDFGKCPEFSQFCALLKWFPLLGIPSPPGNMPPVLQGPTYVACYPCGVSLTFLSELAATPCTPTAAILFL